MEIKVLPNQYNLLTSNKSKILVLGGVGSGKSYGLGDLLVKYRHESVHNEIMIGANTHRQLRDSTIKAITDRLSMYGFNNEEHYSYEENKGFFNLLGMRCYMRTLENVDKSIAGLTLHKILLDEFAFCGRPNQPAMYVYKKLLQRLRGPTEVDGDRITRQLVAVTSPNGYDHLHEIWVVNKTNDHEIIHCKTKDNIFLPGDYYNSLVAVYGGEDTPIARQELFGEFVHINEGKAYYAFDHTKHVQETTRIPGTLFTANDFNVSPMTCIIFQVIDGEIHVHDEIFLRDSDTFQMGYEMTKKARGAQVIPDSTAKNRKTSGKTDLQILKDMGFSIMPTRNPFVRDRVNNVNRLLIKEKIKINPKCKHLIEDLEKVVWKGNDLDQKTDPMRTHASDCLGYGAYKLMNMEPSFDATIRLY